MEASNLSRNSRPRRYPLPDPFWKSIVVMPKREISVLLIVEHTNLQERLERGMQGRYRLKVVTDLEKGLAMACSSIPDIIMIQSNMPKDRIMAVGNALKKNQLTSHIPIILIHDDNLPREEAALHFADAILIASFSQKEMIVALQNVISKKIQLMKRYPIFYNSNNAFAREHAYLSDYMEQLRK